MRQLTAFAALLLCVALSEAFVILPPRSKAAIATHVTDQRLPPYKTCVPPPNTFFAMIIPLENYNKHSRRERFFSPRAFHIRCSTTGPDEFFSKWYSQVLDHFNFASPQRTWQQRYLVTGTLRSFTTHLFGL
jgi:hypothetical protein